MMMMMLFLMKNKPINFIDALTKGTLCKLLESSKSANFKFYF